MVATASVKRAIVAKSSHQRRASRTTGASRALFVTISRLANLRMAKAALLNNSVSTAAVRSMKHRFLAGRIRTRVCALIRRCPS